MDEKKEAAVSPPYEACGQNPTAEANPPAHGFSAPPDVRPLNVRELLETVESGWRVFLIVLTVLGFFLYLTLGLATNLFYHRLGVDPSEVGIGYGSLIGTSLLGIGSLLALWAVFSVPALLLVPLSFRRRTVRVLAYVGASMTVGVVLVGVPLLGWTEGGLAARGGITPRLPGQPWTEDPVGAYALGNTNVAVPEDGRCLLYLGAAAGLTVLYDPSHASSLYVPTDSVFLQRSVRGFCQRGDTLDQSPDATHERP